MRTAIAIAAARGHATATMRDDSPFNMATMIVTGATPLGEHELDALCADLVEEGHDVLAHGITEDGMTAEFNMDLPPTE